MQIEVPEYLERAQKAYKNPDFLNSREARTLRILAEYEYPEQVFMHNDVKNTVVFFGSSRILPKNRFEEKLSVLKGALKNAKGKQKKELELRRTSMKQHRKYCRYYDEAVELSRLMTEWCLKLPKGKQFRICSGGGFGIMEAANRGAFEACGESIGLNISLRFEQTANPYITPKFNFEFHYFYMRKLWFMYYAKALVVFPGGFGTLDELFELLTLVQTGKITKPLLIVLYGELYWRNIINFNGLLEAGMISEEDLSLFTYANNPKAEFEFLKDELPKHLV
ncbi:MAG: TIGR00730 family Rossman fold protein [Candidatus Heimdallarchaeota archaeon]|nr:TIGR00730 family Rossman fold protein [Candidatus Heimdallarchaeota archaeon]